MILHQCSIITNFTVTFSTDRLGSVTQKALVIDNKYVAVEIHSFTVSVSWRPHTGGGNLLSGRSSCSETEKQAKVTAVGCPVIQR